MAGGLAPLRWPVSAETSTALALTQASAPGWQSLKCRGRAGRAEWQDVKHTGDPLEEGLEQLDGYLERLGLDSGTLLIFDRRPSAVERHPDPEFSEVNSPAGRKVILLRA